MSIAKGKASVKAAELKIKGKEKADAGKSKMSGLWKRIRGSKDKEQKNEE